MVPKIQENYFAGIQHGYGVSCDLNGCSLVLNSHIYRIPSSYGILRKNKLLKEELHTILFNFGTEKLNRVFWLACFSFVPTNCDLGYMSVSRNFLG